MKDQRGTFQDETVLTFRDVVRFYKKNKFKIALSGAVFGIIGVGFSMLLPFKYVSSAKILPELQNKSSLSGFRALADLAGINLDNMQTSEAIRPDLYPSVLSSKPFLMKVAKLKVQALDSRQPETVEQLYARQKSPIGGIKGALFGWLQRDNKDDSPNRLNGGLKVPAGVLMLSEKDARLLTALSASIVSGFDKKTGIISVEVTAPDPVVAAWIAQFSIDYLTDYMNSYLKDKRSDQADFLMQQKLKAQTRVREADRNLRAFRDRNKNPFLSLSTSEESKLQSEVNVAENLYSELSRQVEQAQIKKREESPVLQVLEPPQVPLKRDSPKRANIAILFSLFGFFVGTLGALIGGRKGSD